MKMDINNLNAKVMALSRERSFDNLEQIEKIMEAYMEDYNSIDLLLRLAVLELCPPLMDTERSIYYLEKVLKQEKSNIYAWILKGYIGNTMCGGISEDLVAKLKGLETSNLEYKSIFYYLIAWHYYHKKEFGKYKDMLLKSIEYCSSHVYNYSDLGKYLIGEGHVIEGVKLIKKALENIKHVYSDEEDLDVTDLSEFISEHIKGTHITEINLEDLRETLHKNEV